MSCCQGGLLSAGVAANDQGRPGASLPVPCDDNVFVTVDDRARGMAYLAASTRELARQNLADCPRTVPTCCFRHSRKFYFSLHRYPGKTVVRIISKMNGS